MRFRVKRMSTKATIKNHYLVIWLSYFALLTSVMGCAKNTGVIAVSRSSFENGVTQVLEVKGDGTYVQRITDKTGETFTNTGTWQRYRERAGPPGVPADGSHVELKGWVNAGEVADGKAASSAERVDFLVPANSFSRPPNR